MNSTNLCRGSNLKSIMPMLAQSINQSVSLSLTHSLSRSVGRSVSQCVGGSDTELDKDNQLINVMARKKDTGPCSGQ